MVSAVSSHHIGHGVDEVGMLFEISNATSAVEQEMLSYGLSSER